MNDSFQMPKNSNQLPAINKMHTKVANAGNKCCKTKFIYMQQWWANVKSNLSSETHIFITEQLNNFKANHKSLSTNTENFQEYVSSFY